MADRYWVGGTGNWSDDTNHWATSSGGSPGAGNKPTASDNANFDTLSNATAYTVTIDASSVCLDFILGAPLTGKVTWAGSSALAISGSMNLSGGTAGITRSYTGAITFNSTSTGKTLTFNGVTTASTTVFNGSGGGWTIQDTWNNGSSGVTLNAGTLDTNGQTITWGIFNASAGSTKVLTLGASTINGSSFNLNASDLTFNSNTSTINMSASATLTASQTYAFNNVAWTAGGSMSMSLGTTGTTFVNVTVTGAASKTDTFTVSNNTTISGTLTINGNSTTNRILFSSNTTGTARTITSAANSFTNLDIMDITAAGAASWNLSAITGNSGDCQGNTGITFTAPADQHWQSASSGNWSTAANWTSRVPLPQDDVFMDKAFGTSQTVTLDMPRAGKSIDWTGATWTTALSWNTNTQTAIFGSLTLISGLTATVGVTISLSGRSSYTIKCNGVSNNIDMRMVCPGGTYTLSDDFTGGQSVSAGRGLDLRSGTFNANNFNFTANYMSSVNLGFSRTLTMGSGTWSLNSDTSSSSTQVNLQSTGLTFNVNTSTIKLTSTTNNSVKFDGGGLTFKNLWFSRGASTGDNIILSSNTFTDIKDDGTAAHSLKITAGTTQTVTTFTVSGNGAGNEIAINSDTTGTHTLRKTGGGTISRDYLTVQHSIAAPSLTWYAGTHSTDNQATATAGRGWIFTAPPTNTMGIFSAM